MVTINNTNSVSINSQYGGANTSETSSENQKKASEKLEDKKNTLDTSQKGQQLKHEYTEKQMSLKQNHIRKKQKLDQQYSQAKQRLQSEYNQESLEISVYA